MKTLNVMKKLSLIVLLIGSFSGVCHAESGGYKTLNCAGGGCSYAIDKIFNNACAKTGIKNHTITRFRNKVTIQWTCNRPN